MAEDEKALSEALVAVLEKNGFGVDAVYNGRAALEHLETQIYDGAILDVMMPGTDGITVLQTLRERGDMLPVMILTARAEIEDRVEGLDSGANDYLAKPFDTRELLARIRAMVRVQNQPEEDALAAGNIKLDCSTLEMSSDVSSFRLSGKEFQMMKIFMKNPDSQIPAEYFMEKIWDLNGKEQNDVVWVYVSFLRKKLEALHANIGISAVEENVYRLEVTGP